MHIVVSRFTLLLPGVHQLPIFSGEGVVSDRHFCWPTLGVQGCSLARQSSGEPVLAVISETISDTPVITVGVDLVNTTLKKCIWIG